MKKILFLILPASLVCHGTAFSQTQAHTAPVQGKAKPNSEMMTNQQRLAAAQQKLAVAEAASEASRKKLSKATGDAQRAMEIATKAQQSAAVALATPSVSLTASQNDASSRLSQRLQEATASFQQFREATEKYTVAPFAISDLQETTTRIAKAQDSLESLYNVPREEQAIVHGMRSGHAIVDNLTAANLALDAIQNTFKKTGLSSTSVTGAAMETAASSLTKALEESRVLLALLSPKPQSETQIRQKMANEHKFIQEAEEQDAQYGIFLQEADKRAKETDAEVEKADEDFKRFDAEVDRLIEETRAADQELARKRAEGRTAKAHPTDNTEIFTLLSSLHLISIAPVTTYGRAEITRIQIGSEPEKRARELRDATLRQLKEKRQELAAARDAFKVARDAQEAARKAVRAARVVYRKALNKVKRLQEALDALRAARCPDPTAIANAEAALNAAQTQLQSAKDAMDKAQLAYELAVNRVNFARAVLNNAQAAATAAKEVYEIVYSEWYKVAYPTTTVNYTLPAKTLQQRSSVLS